MAEPRKGENLLLLALVVAMREDDDPVLRELVFRASRRGFSDSGLDEELRYYLEHAMYRPRGHRRLDDMREIANSVLDGFRQGFQERVEKQVESLTSRVAGLEISREFVGANTDELQASQTSTAHSLHEFIWMLSSGADLTEARTTRYVPLRLFVGDPVPDEASRQRVITAVEALLEPLGFEPSFELPEESGSWWKRLLLRTKGALTHAEVQKRLKTAEQAIEANYLDKPQAEANHLQAGAAAQLITALGTTPNACVQVGSLLLVKATDQTGACAVIARTLTRDELRRIEENQAILRQPEQILEWLQGRTHDRLPPAST